jgi:uncharacterized membrane protein
MGRTAKAELRELFFRVSIAVKGVFAAFEILTGAALFAVSPDWILRVISSLTQDELAEDPRDRVANALLDAAKRLSLGSEHFAAIYLVSHGAVKLGLVAALLKDELWAYPLAIIVFGGFIAYQIYRFTFTHALSLVALSLFDILVIWLIWLEYRALKRARSGRG